MNLEALSKRTFAVLSLVALLLFACGEPSAPPNPTPSVDPTPATAPYVGRWAVSLAGCQNGAWEFAKDSVGAAGEVSCVFKKVTPGPSGYAVEAECTAQAPPELTSFTLAFSGVGPAERMTVAGGPWSGPVALIRCPP